MIINKIIPNIIPIIPPVDKPALWTIEELTLLFWFDGFDSLLTTDLALFFSTNEDTFSFLWGTVIYFLEIFMAVSYCSTFLKILQMPVVEDILLQYSFNALWQSIISVLETPSPQPSKPVTPTQVSKPSNFGKILLYIGAALLGIAIIVTVIIIIHTHKKKKMT